MALIKCDECGRSISDKSLFCPGCGYPTHLNKALRVRQDDAAEGSPAEPTTIVLADTPHAKIELIYTPENRDSDAEEPEVEKDEELDEDFDEDIDEDADEEASEDADAEKVFSAKVGIEPIMSIEASLSVNRKKEAEAAGKAAETAATTEATDVEGAAEESDPLADYEATLSHPRSPKSNNRMKLVLYFAVLLVLLAAVFLCYYYAKSNHLGSIDEVQCEPIDELPIEEVITASPAADSDSTTVNVTPAPSDSSDVTEGTPALPEQPAVVASPAVQQL